MFADLGLEDADELFTRSRLGFHVYKTVTDRSLSNGKLPTLLGIKQPEVSHLMNGHFSRFTAEKLLDFLKRLDQKVTIQISHIGQASRIRRLASACERRGDGDDGTRATPEIHIDPKKGRAVLMPVLRATENGSTSKSIMRLSPGPKPWDSTSQTQDSCPAKGAWPELGIKIPQETAQQHVTNSIE